MVERFQDSEIDLKDQTDLVEEKIAYGTFGIQNQLYNAYSQNHDRNQYINVLSSDN